MSSRFIGSAVAMVALCASAHASVIVTNNQALWNWRVVNGGQVVGTENFSQDAMPVPGAAPTGGRRGAYLLVDAPAVAATLAARFARDWAPDRFGDLQPYVAGHARYGDPPADYTPPPPPAYAVPTAPFAAPATATGRCWWRTASSRARKWRGAGSPCPAR